MDEKEKPFLVHQLILSYQFGSRTVQCLDRELIVTHEQKCGSQSVIENEFGEGVRESESLRMLHC